MQFFFREKKIAVTKKVLKICLLKGLRVGPFELLSYPERTCVYFSVFFLVAILMLVCPAMVEQ